MRQIFVLLLSLASVINLSAQEKRKSPKAEVSDQIDGVNVSITYGQPSKNDRDIFGGLVPYDKIWRTGANEATVLEVDQAVQVNGQNLKAGKYALFTIPGEESWTIILNGVWNQWGAYNYDQSKDVLRFEVDPEESDLTEKFTIEINEDGTIEMKWDKTAVSFMVEGA